MKNFIFQQKKLLIFFRDYGKIVLDASYKSKENETKETGLKVLTPKHMLQRLPTAREEVKAGNNSESFLNEIS